MAFSDIPILSTLKSKLKWHQARQTVLAQNIANANTPNYQPRDLKRVSMGVSAMKTNAGHLSMANFSIGGDVNGFKAEKSADWETTPNGNAVSLEDQMIKVTENQMEYQAATTLYSRSLGLLRLAVGKN